MSARSDALPGHPNGRCAWPSNLTPYLDIIRSMNRPNRYPLFQRGSDSEKLDSQIFAIVY